jgi:hypothetical protein
LNSENSKLPSLPWGPQIISKALQMCLTIISSIAKSGSNPSWILYSTPSLERILQALFAKFSAYF